MAAVLLDTDVFSALYIIPRVVAQKQGHPVRWIAACAISKGLPLLAGDSIYDGAPGLRVHETR